MNRAEQTLPPPELRATVSEHRLVMTPWTPYLIPPGGPRPDRPSSAKGILDLSVQRETSDEITIATDVIAAEVSSSDRKAVRHALVAWAKALDYRRVWFDDEVIALDPGPLGGTWQTRCTGCGCVWSDRTHGFWLAARARGYFPLSCPWCGLGLPQSTRRCGEHTESGGSADASRMDDHSLVGMVGR